MGSKHINEANTEEDPQTNLKMERKEAKKREENEFLSVLYVILLGTWEGSSQQCIRKQLLLTSALPKIRSATHQGPWGFEKHDRKVVLLREVSLGWPGLGSLKRAEFRVPREQWV